MPNVTYVLKDGTRRDVAVRAGDTVMRGAIDNNLRGIDAECGGCCSCATCHVYVDEAWAAKLKAPDAVENDLLDGVASDRKPTSRLSCQSELTAGMDGLVVHIPPTQS